METMDNDLRAGLWNVFRPHFVDSLTLSGRSSQDYRIACARMRTIWDGLFKAPNDEAPGSPDTASRVLKPLFLGADYLSVYDLIDFTVQEFGLYMTGLESQYNRILEREVSGFRFVGSILCPISSEYELQAIEDGLAVGGGLAGAATHLQTALKYLSDRESPDYRNSVKESISAVESAARAITGKPKATLGDLLPVMQTAGRIHPAQREAFSKLYGYTSDEDGIRHSMLESADVDFATAKYMLAVCSAFIAYLSINL